MPLTLDSFQRTCLTDKNASAIGGQSNNLSSHRPLSIILIVQTVINFIVALGILWYSVNFIVHRINYRYDDLKLSYNLCRSKRSKFYNFYIVIYYVSQCNVVRNSNVKVGIKSSLSSSSTSLSVFSFVFPSYFLCLAQCSGLKLKCKRVNPVGIEQFFHVTESIFLRFFLTLHPQKPSAFCPPSQPPKNGFVICVIAFT